MRSCTHIKYGLHSHRGPLWSCKQEVHSITTVSLTLLLCLHTMAFTTLHSSSNCRRPFTSGASGRREQSHACSFRPLCKPLGAAAGDDSLYASSTPRLESQPDAQHTYSRRQHLLAALASAAAVAASGLAAPRPAAAFTQPPEGFSLHLDKLDGYQFFYPELWTGVTSSGNDIFLRNPFNVRHLMRMHAYVCTVHA